MESKPIQIIPQGLLGLLQLKNMGQNPSILPDTLQSVLEMRDWLVEGEIRMTSGITGVLPNGTLGPSLTAATFIVPDGEMWVLKGMTCGCAQVVGDAFEGYCAFQPPNFAVANAVRLLGPIVSSPAVAEAKQWRASWNACGEMVIAPPGSRFGVYMTRFLSPAGVAVNAFVHYRRVPI